LSWNSRSGVTNPEQLQLETSMWKRGFKKNSGGAAASLWRKSIEKYGRAAPKIIEER